MPIFSIAKFFVFFAFWSGAAFLNMPSEPNLAPQSCFKRVCGKRYPLALRSCLKAIFLFFTKPGGRKLKITWSVNFFDP